MTLTEEERERLRLAFSEPEPPRELGQPGMSAILVPLFERPDGLHVLYTRRASSLSRHPGEVSFPGGRIDPGDAGPLAAALRETQEEVGIPPASVEIVGHLSDFVTFYGRLVVAYVGLVRGEPPTKPNSLDEVESVFTAPVSALLGPDLYEARALAEAPARVVHYWRLPEAVMWGITGELTARFLRRAYGWKPPRAPVLIEEPSEFIPTE